jgi:redox-sensitive bicupin YhaK (pirin superfamily)
MLTVRSARNRGHFDHGWLDTWHTFSFSGYYDPRHMGFRALRVINEDRVEPGKGFGTHPHQDMEILTYVLAGGLEHRDSLGTGQVIHAGELQRMTAGTGITHSEVNASREEPVHLYQIWLLPERKGLEPSYEQKAFDPSGRLDQFQLVASPNAREGSLKLRQDASVYLVDVSAGQLVTHPLAPGRHAWVQVLSGAARLNGVDLNAGDGAALGEEPRLALHSDQGAELLVFDLA